MLLSKVVVYLTDNDMVEFTGNVKTVENPEGRLIIFDSQAEGGIRAVFAKDIWRYWKLY